MSRVEVASSAKVANTWIDVDGDVTLRLDGLQTNAEAICRAH